MRILVLSTVHRWNDPRIFHKEACTLAQEHEVIHAAVGEGEEQIVNGVRVRLLGIWKSRADRVLLWLRAYREIFKWRPDAIHFHDPELALILLPLAFLSNMRMVCDIHEDPTEGYGRRPWIPKYLRGMIRGFFGLLLRVAPAIYDVVILAEDSYRSHFPKKDNIHMLRNYAIIPEPDVPYYDRFEGYDPQKELRLIFVGVLMKYRGAYTMIDIVDKLKDVYPNVTLDLIGRAQPLSIETDLKEAAERLDGRIKLHGYIDWKEMESHFRRAHIGLVPIKPFPNLTGSLATKLYDYMIYGLPFVASNFPLWMEFVKQNPAGITEDATDAEAFAKAIANLAESPDKLRELSHNGYRLVREKFSWQKESETLLQIYRDFS